MKLPTFKAIVADAVEIIKWFRNHHVPLAELREKQKQIYGKEKALKLPVATRWQSYSETVHSVLDSKNALEQTIALPGVQQALAKATKAGARPGLKVKTLIHDDTFWGDLSNLKQIVDPFLFEILRSEKDKPSLSGIHSRYIKLIGHTFMNIPSVHARQVADILRTRWNRIRTPEMILAAILDVTLPNRLAEPSPQVLKEVHSWLVTQFPERPPSDQHQPSHASIYAELLSFINKRDIYADSHYWNTAVLSAVHPLDWWKSHFKTDLSELAQDLLSIIPSSGTAERNWSTFGYIHSKSRNRLRNERVEKLVFLYSNAHLTESFVRLQPEWFDEEEAPQVDTNTNEEEEPVEQISDKIAALESGDDQAISSFDGDDDLLFQSMPTQTL